MLKISTINQKYILTALVLLALIGAMYGITEAQGPSQELLVNNTMDSYYGTGGGNVVPVGWALTADGGVSSAKQDWVFNEFPGFGASWEVSAASRTFTMIASQFVPAVRSGTKVRFSVYSNLFTCNKNTSCIEASVGHRVSDVSSGARTRIGFDPNGGSDPNAASVIWSPYISPFDTFQQASIDSQSQNDNGVTLYLNATQSVGMLLNKVYWDNASLQVLGAGAGEATQVPRVVPFVTPQGQQPDGSIIHIVKAGDTLASIAVAYKVTVQHIRELNSIPQDEFLLRIGQKLIIQTAPPPPVTYIVVTSTPTEDPNQTWTPTPTPTATIPGAGVAPTQPYVIITLAPPTATPLVGSYHVPVNGVGASLVSNRGWQDIPVRLPNPAPQPALLSTADASVCVTAYDDRNTNRYRDANETALAGVGLRLTQGDQEVLNLITTTGEPACFKALASGTYTLLAVPPDTYGLTTANRVRIEVNSDAQIDLSFGATAGYKPTATVGVPGTLAPRPVGEAPGWLGAVWDNSGLIVLGAAGVVLVGGLVLAARNH